MYQLPLLRDERVQAPRLPSRYEDLDPAFRGRLRPNAPLIELVRRSYRSMQVNGGIRFLPIYGRSGTGKSSAALELGTHLPEAQVRTVSRAAIESRASLEAELRQHRRSMVPEQLLIAIVDQYEEAVAERGGIPTAFVETLSLLDRGELRELPVLFIWLTTSREFQTLLADATSRNRRILVSRDFELMGPMVENWPQIIEETFGFHNHDKDLADYEILEGDLRQIAQNEDSIGDAIEAAGAKLFDHVRSLHDLSDYQVIILWPVSDGLRIQRIQQFTDARQGYKLDWNAWYRQLNSDDQRQLPLREFNRARLYFDVRLVPISVADLHPLCKALDNDGVILHKSYLDRFRSTHFFSLVSGQWNAEAYSPLRERDSKRAEDARLWYDTVTTNSVGLGRRIAKILRELEVSAEYEKTQNSPHGQVRADLLVTRDVIQPKNVIVELKAYSAENTMPSTICGAVQTTLRRHAQFVGFLQRQ
ncbi:ATP-binding protein [Burkholderia gladioli]|uniref:ATP-binding protein n=1 Tax=Burkholderia gladioli TaxID=28095 RepID=UPI001C5E4B69|nr:ATP-binding protein [Burkholderia gladioli]MBW5283419.1 ATP-binding protein [Burkholderia gladioli]